MSILKSGGTKTHNFINELLVHVFAGKIHYILLGARSRRRFFEVNFSLQHFKDQHDSPLQAYNFYKIINRFVDILASLVN